MQMYLWSSACNAPSVVINDVDGANDAFIVYHEYTHGLSNRLVTDAAGVGALGGPQSGAMGEGWSDWYALDLLVAEGREIDTAAPGELRTGQYEAEPVRTRALRLPGGRRLHPRVPARGRRARAATHTGTSGDRFVSRERRPRGARRRRDLGPDAVGPAPDADRAARQPRPASPRPGADHRRHAALAREPVLPRRAQRDPAGRREPRLRRPRPDLGGVRRARHGRERQDHGRRRQSPRWRTSPGRRRSSCPTPRPRSSPASR